MLFEASTHVCMYIHTYEILNDFPRMALFYYTCTPYNVRCTFWYSYQIVKLFFFFHIPGILFQIGIIPFVSTYFIFSIQVLVFFLVGFAGLYELNQIFWLIFKIKFILITIVFVREQYAFVSALLFFSLEAIHRMIDDMFPFLFFFFIENVSLL